MYDKEDDFNLKKVNFHLLVMSFALFPMDKGPDKEIYERKSVVIYLPINLTCVLGAQKNRLVVIVLLSTHNICFG